MKVGLIDVDGHHYPNLALRTCRSQRVIKGGTGYAITLENGVEVYHAERDLPLAPEIEHIYPDYSLYPDLTKETAFGFLTRGCPRGCAFCHVAGKEGRASKKVADLSEFWSGQRNVTIMDPNILACKEREDLLAQLVASAAYGDFNQGLDIRLIDNDVTDLLGEMRVKCLHFAWDNPEDDLEPFFARFSERYTRKDRRTKVVYVLTNFGSTQKEDLHRIYTLRRLGFDPYVMIYNKQEAPRETRLLQRWCNNRVIFNTVPDFKDYNAKMG